MRIQNVLNSDKVTIRDKAIFLLGYVLDRSCNYVLLNFLNPFDIYTICNCCIHFETLFVDHQISFSV